MPAPVIEVADCTESGNNTATTSWAVSYPAYASGDLLCFHVASDANVTHNWSATGPNGETVVDISDSYGGSAQRISAFYFVGSATTGASTFTVTPSATEQWTAVVVKVPAGEFDSTTPVQATIGSANVTTAGTGLATPTWTAGAKADGKIVVAAAIDVLTTTAAPTGWTALIQRDRGAVGILVGVRNAATTASESIASATFTKNSETHSVIGYVINAPAPVLTIDAGSFTLSGQTATFEKGDSVRQGGDPAPLPHLGLLLAGSAAPEITLAHGSFTLSGQDADLDADRKLALAHGSFALSGQAAGIDADRKIAAAHGAFTLSGQDADLDADRKLALAYGSFTLTGQTVGLGSAISLSVDAGSFTLSGQTVAFDYTSSAAQGGDPAPLPHLGLVLQPAAKTITADYGSHALSGQAIGLRVGRSVSGAYGGYTLSGQDVVFPLGRTFAVEYGDFALSGQSVGLAPLGRLPLEYGTITLSGQSVGLSKQGDLNLVYGDFALSGQAAALTYRRRLPQAFGSYALSGSVALRAARKITAGAGSFVLSGQAFTLISRGSAWYPAPFPHLGMLLAPQAGVYSIGAEYGTFTLAGQNVALSTPTLFSIEAGTFTLTGMDADRDISMSAGLGSYTLSGQTVTFGGALSIGAERGLFALTGRDVTFRLLRSYDLTASTGTYTLTGRAAALRHGRKTSAGVASFTLSGQAADIDADRRLAIGHGAYTVTGYAATLTEGQSLSAATGVFTLTGQNANLAVSFVRLSAELGGFTVTFQDATLKPYRLFAETGTFDLNGQDAQLQQGVRETAGGGSGFVRVNPKDRRKFKDYFERQWTTHHRIPLEHGEIALKGRAVVFKRTERFDPSPLTPEIRRRILSLPKKTKEPEFDLDALIAQEIRHAEELATKKRNRRRKQDDEILLLM